MATIQPGLFGYDPTEINQANQQRFATVFGQAGSPYEKIGLSLGQLGTSAIKGLFDIQDPAIAANKEATSIAGQFDLNTAAGLKEYTAALQLRAQETGNPALAAIVPRAAAEYQKAALAEATIEQKTREKAVPINEQVNQGLYAQALKDAKGDPILAAKLYNDRELAEKQRIAQAGVPQPGQVPLTTLGQAVNLVGEFTDKPKAKLDQLKVVTSLGAGVKTNPTLLSQFQREAVKFAGDNQISSKEVERVLGSSGFASDTIDGINKFLTGAPTNAKIDDVLRGFKVLESAYATQYNAGLKKAATVLEQGKIDPRTQEAILPPAYNVKPKVTAPAVGTIKNGWQFLGGDPANQSSWKAVK